jgi:hypothetical protein
VGKITFYSFSYRYIINKLRVFNAVRLPAASPKDKDNGGFLRGAVERRALSKQIQTDLLRASDIPRWHHSGGPPFAIRLRKDGAPSG